MFPACRPFHFESFSALSLLFVANVSISVCASTRLLSKHPSGEVMIFLRKGFERLCVLGDHITVSFWCRVPVTVLLYTVLKNKYFTASTHYAAGSRRKDI